MILPPWIQAANPVPAFAQGISQGAAIAGEQNRADQYLVEAQRAAQAEALRAQQFAQELAIQRERERRLSQQAGAELKLTEQTFANRAADAARQLAAQRKIQEGINAGMKPADAIRAAAGFLPVQAIGQLAAVDAASQRRNLVQEALQNRQLMKLQADTGVRFMDEAGNVDQERLGEAIKISGKVRTTPSSIRALESKASALEKVFPELGSEEIDDLQARIISGGTAAINPPKAVRDTVLAMDTVVQAYGDSLAMVDRFNQKFGKDAFEKFTGPIEGRIQLMRQRLAGFSDEDARMAREIVQRIEEATSGFRLDLYGKNLTSSEQKLFEEVKATTRQGGYLDSVRSLSNILGDKVAIRLGQFPGATDIPKAVSERYSGRTRGLFNAEAQPAGQTATNAPASNKIRSIRQVR